MRITTLGELAVDGRPVRGERLAAVVRALVEARGRTVTPGALAETVWGGAPPEDAIGAVHALIGRARRLGLPVAAAPGGYRVPPEEIELDTVLAKAHLAAGTPQLARALFPDAPDLSDAATAALFAEVAAARRDEADLRLLAGRTPPHEPSAALLVRVLAAQGRDAEALEVVERLRATLADTYGADPSAAVAEAHLALLRGELSAAPAPTTEPARPKSTLPAAWRRSATPMLGRDADVAAVRAALAEAPLVTVVAVGGAGKTRLAAEVARGAAAGGTPVHVVELAGLRSASEVLPAVLAAADPATGTRGTAERLQEFAGLVVLDNCEHVLAGAADVVAELLAAAPDAAVLATSRAPLGLAGEVVHRLHTLADDAARQLLTARSRAGGAMLSDGAAAQALCHRLDNLPLALELAAARLRHMPIEDVLAGLDDRFGLLDDALRGLPERHASLWAMVDWSRELLGPEQQRLLERLAVIPAPFTAEAAECVSGLPRRGLAVHLAGLVEQSLLGLAEGGDGRARYRMLETVREYGEARLAASGERDAAMDGLVAWARQEAPRIHAELIGPGQIAAFARCAAEQDNLVAALRRCVGRDDAAAVDVAAPLLHLWTVRGLHFEVLPWSLALLHADDPHLRRSGRLVAQADPDRLAWICLLAGLNAFATDRYRLFALSRRMLRELIARRSDELSPRARALGEILPALTVLDLTRGMVSAERLVADPDPYAQGFGLFLRAAIRENRGDTASAAERAADAELAYRRFEQAGDHWAMGMAAQSIGSQGAPGAAEWLRRGAAHMELLGAAEDAGSIRILLDVQLAHAGDDDAAARLRAVVEAPVPDPPPHGMQVMDAAQAHLGLAQHAWMRGRPADAVEHAERANAIANKSPAPVPQARVVFGVAAGVLRLRAFGAAGASRAGQLLAETRDEAFAGHDVPALGSWALAAATLAAHLGEPAEAKELWALGERCGANLMQLFDNGVDARLESVLGGADERAERAAAWRERPVTEITDRIRELADKVLQTFRR
ncbi:BTAD domain-containing putative transcriptional regulator [Dactylosporangium darangshiense]|uniref:BTAD domain-containing putative transcriptional regulator n=1 Tax=Dactylosporangium darangshiense TaxID=579108 RepID=A0ABP8D8M4_9ACTN